MTPLQQAQQDLHLARESAESMYNLLQAEINQLKTQNAQLTASNLDLQNQLTVLQSGEDASAVAMQTDIDRIQEIEEAAAQL